MIIQMKSSICSKETKGLENLLQAMEDDNIGFVLNRGGDDKYDDRKTQLSKISENY
jgi:hypothetical protein